jgi:two-component system cell cycle sensor histidine kinase/response regulator CckA
MQNEELRRSHQALLLARDAYRELYDHAPVGYLSLDRRGFIQESNVTASHLFGMERAGLRGTPLSALMTDADADAFHLHLVEVFESRARCTRVIDVQRPDGVTLTLRLDSVAVVDGEPPVRCRTTLTDVSETRRMQAELQTLNHELEERVAERTEKLRVANERLVEQLRERERTEEQLLHARKLEAVARLAGGIAHDFNNLLTVIKLQTASTRRAFARSTSPAANLDEIDRATTLATALAGKLMTFGRRGTAVTGRSDAAQVLVEVEPLLRGLCGTDVEMSLTIAPGEACVGLDATALEQVLLNLTLNARDAMPAGGTLTIEVAHADDHVTITVRDTGVGMSAETLEHLFEPFYTTKARERGTGLGLSTAHGLVAQAGGFIHVESALGKGSELTVYLPRLSNGIRASALRPSQAPSETILLVDDEEAVRGAVAGLLVDAGYHVLTAGSGAEALEILARDGGSIDVVLTDVAMPSMTGFTLAARIREQLPGVPVVFMSGYLGDEHLDSGELFVQKPFTLPVLLRTIRSALDRQPQLHH